MSKALSTARGGTSHLSTHKGQWEALKWTSVDGPWSPEEGGVAAGGGRYRMAVCKRATECHFEGAGGVGNRMALGTGWRWEQGGARDRTGGKMALSVSEVFSFFR